MSWACDKPEQKWLGFCLSFICRTKLLSKSSGRFHFGFFQPCVGWRCFLDKQLLFNNRQFVDWTRLTNAIAEMRASSLDEANQQLVSRNHVILGKSHVEADLCGLARASAHSWIALRCVAYARSHLQNLKWWMALRALRKPSLLGASCITGAGIHAVAHAMRFIHLFRMPCKQFGSEFITNRDWPRGNIAARLTGECVAKKSINLNSDNALGVNWVTYSIEFVINFASWMFKIEDFSFGSASIQLGESNKRLCWMGIGRRIGRYATLRRIHQISH